MPLDYGELQRELEARRRAARQKPQSRAAAPQRPATEPGQRRSPRPPRSPVELVATAVTAVLAIAALAAFVTARPSEPVGSFPYRAGLAVGLVAAAVYVMGLLRILRRWGEPRTTAAALVAPIIIFLLATAGGGTVATVALTVINARLDNATPSVHRVIVVDKNRVDGQHGGYARITVPFWRDNGVSLDFRLPLDQYDRIQPRRTQLVVTTRPGKLGWEWIDGAPAVENPSPGAAAPEGPTGPSEAAVAASAARAATFVGEPQTARQFLERGLQRLRESLPEPAAADFARAIELDPSLHEAYESQAEALRPSRDYDGIIRVWTKLLAVQPDNAHAWHQRANARLAKHDLAGAQADAEEACRLGENSICPLAARLRARAEAGR